MDAQLPFDLTAPANALAPASKNADPTRLIIVLRVAAALGLCAALLAATTYWALEHQAALQRASVTAANSSPAYAAPVHDCQPFGITGPWADSGDTRRACGEAWQFSARLTPAALRYTPAHAEQSDVEQRVAAAARQPLLEPLYD
jgi:hypothetical protein